jgi:hypothetical protein
MIRKLTAGMAFAAGKIVIAANRKTNHRLNARTQAEKPGLKKPVFAAAKPHRTAS